MSVIDRFGTRARSAIPAVRAAGMKSNSQVASYVNRTVAYLPHYIETGGYHTAE